MTKYEDELQSEIDIFANLGRELAGTTHAETAARIILEAAGQLIGWDACYLILYDPQKGGSPRPLHTIDTIEGDHVVQHEAAPNQPSVNMLKAIEHGGFLSSYEEYFEIDPAMSFGNHSKRTLSQMFAPVVSGLRTIGVLSIQSYQKHAYANEQLDLLKNLASHCAGALERIWAQEALGDLVTRLKLLHQAVNEINALHDLEQVCQVVYEAVERVMPCNDFVMDGYHSDTNEIVPLFAIEHPNKRVLTEKYTADHGLAGEIVRTKRPLLFESKAEIERSGIKFEIFGSEMPDLTESILAVPMLLRGGIYGMVSAQSYVKNAYSQDDLYLLETLASHAAIAIENARLFDSFQRLASTDPLTGILNRRRFFELAEVEYARAEKNSLPFCVILLDIDDFKKFNDRYGHKAGDFILTQTAEACKASLRDDDIFCRLGGEEFVVALPNTDLVRALEVANRLRIAVETSNQTGLLAGLPAENDLSVTVSVGVADYDSSCRTLDALIDRADQAMYRSKNSGRNQVQAWRMTK